MNDMLRELYYGRVHPYEREFRKADEISAMSRRSIEFEKMVTDCLDEAGRERFSEFLKADSELGDNQQFDAFVCGFRIGARLMIDTLADDHT